MLCIVTQLCSIPWTVARQVLLSMGILWPRILEWVAMPSSRGSSQPRDQTQVSCIAERIFLLSEPQGKHVYVQCYANDELPSQLSWLRICLQCRRPGFDTWLRRFPGEGNGNPLQDSCLENPKDRGGAWQATVHGVARIGHDLATKLLLLCILFLAQIHVSTKFRYRIIQSFKRNSLILLLCIYTDKSILGQPPICFSSRYYCHVVIVL